MVKCLVVHDSAEIWQYLKLFLEHVKAILTMLNWSCRPFKYMPVFTEYMVWAWVATPLHWGELTLQRQSTTLFLRFRRRDRLNFFWTEVMPEVDFSLVVVQLAHLSMERKDRNFFLLANGCVLIDKFFDQLVNKNVDFSNCVQETDMGNIFSCLNKTALALTCMGWGPLQLHKHRPSC